MKRILSVSRPTDLGAYNTCPHGCVYCCANSNKAAARRTFDRHDPDSAFLGYPRLSLMPGSPNSVSIACGEPEGTRAYWARRRVP